MALHDPAEARGFSLRQGSFSGGTDGRQFSLDDFSFLTLEARIFISELPPFEVAVFPGS